MDEYTFRCEKGQLLYNYLMGRMSYETYRKNYLKLDDEFFKGKLQTK